MRKVAEHQIPVEEEKKLITVNTYMDKLAEMKFADINLENKKEKIIFGIKKDITSLGIAIMEIRKNEDVITEKLGDEILGNLYSQNPLFSYVQNFMEASKRRFLLQDGVINSLCEFALDIIPAVNDVIETVQSKTPSPQQSFDDGTPQLNESEREALKRNVHSLVIYYKEANSASRSSILYQLDQMADTKEKFAIIDDTFFQLTGENALEKYRKEKQEVPP